MPGLTTETALLYGNIIDEIKVRLKFVDKALAYELADRSEWIAVSDFCCLQFRKIFEAISLGCLLVHGDLPGIERHKDNTYRADTLLKALERLHPDFYPKPCTITLREGKQVTVHEAVAGEWLTKVRLRSLYYKLDNEMHVGALNKREVVATPISMKSLVGMRDWTRTLLQTHVINLADPKYAFVVQMNGPNEKPHVRLLQR